jgi:adenylosuccinate synthase
MPNIAIVGAQWGDEGKGKVVDLIAPAFQVVARYNGGHNAGHTVIRGDRKVVLHLIPSGILHEGTLCVLGAGMVIDPEALDAEIRDIERLGLDIDVLSNLAISDRAHVLLPHHRALDLMSETRRGASKIGTTGRGIGPCYEDKAARRGVRIADVLSPDRIAATLEPAREHYEALCRGFGVAPEVDFGATRDMLARFGERITTRVRDISLLLHDEFARGASVLFEGAQAIHLDIDHGTYPFVTSSSAGVGGVVSGLGIPPSRIDGVIGIVKAYTTRVGAGPFPTELQDARGEDLRSRGGEFGATTGRPRRCGWFDLPLVRAAARVNGMDGMVVTKLDVLDPLEEIPVCVGYRFRNTRLDAPPSDRGVYAECQPIYETCKGWREPTSGIREWRDLPPRAREYLKKLSDLAEMEVAMVSTGPDRAQSVINEKARTAAWLEF